MVETQFNWYLIIVKSTSNEKKHNINNKWLVHVGSPFSSLKFPWNSHEIPPARSPWLPPPLPRPLSLTPHALERHPPSPPRRRRAESKRDLLVLACHVGPPFIAQVGLYNSCNACDYGLRGCLWYLELTWNYSWFGFFLKQLSYFFGAPTCFAMKRKGFSWENKKHVMEPMMIHQHWPVKVPECWGLYTTFFLQKWWFCHETWWNTWLNGFVVEEREPNGRYNDHQKWLCLPIKH